MRIVVPKKQQQQVPESREPENFPPGWNIVPGSTPDTVKHIEDLYEYALQYLIASIRIILCGKSHNWTGNFMTIGFSNIRTQMYQIMIFSGLPHDISDDDVQNPFNIVIARLNKIVERPWFEQVRIDGAKLKRLQFTKEFGEEMLIRMEWDFETPDGFYEPVMFATQRFRVVTPDYQHLLN